MERYLFNLEVKGNPLAMFLYIVHVSCVNLNCIRNGTNSFQFGLPPDAEPARNPGQARVDLGGIELTPRAPGPRSGIGIYPTPSFAASAHGETFGPHQRYGRMTQPDTWYVAFGPDKTVKTDDSATGVVRSTRTFKSEVDAKLFAMQIIAKGWSATAGTLNPHQPKQIIGASHIERWADPAASHRQGA
jgi:hypothetical protein